MNAPRIPRRRVTDEPTPDAGLLIVAVLAGWGLVAVVVLVAMVLRWWVGWWA